MKERPILFSAPMVSAILEGRKTQTRRAAKHPLLETLSRIIDCGNGWWGDEEGEIQVRCPYGNPGDRLWVRETWATVDLGYAPQGSDCAIEVAYKTDPADHRIMKYLNWDDAEKYTGAKFHSEWRSPRFMPRWASRILLEVVSVRVERLQDISSMDAVAEGVNVHPDHHSKPRSSIYSPVQAYRNLWESINGDESWEENPWVWVVEFRRVTA